MGYFQQNADVKISHTCHITFVDRKSESNCFTFLSISSNIMMLTFVISINWYGPNLVLI